MNGMIAFFINDTMDYGKTNYELEIDDDTLVEETSLVAFAFLCT